MANTKSDIQDRMHAFESSQVRNVAIKLVLPSPELNLRVYLAIITLPKAINPHLFTQYIAAGFELF
ncbi:MAG: hypothetical protein ABR95_05290 [Sphingobacteriales bacterium BACL12 MAG-120813-bin55]|nr:MAG: hypothetical protein ABR94_12195 [Sphingobacteriales bacterium BACL12 MAG-120802-bin5]KRP13889.1 MAG: hypothetical protein ABR95_05290 [Sphingobacteriales bacterium BACL12 MAG-120813-bin55]